MLAFTNKCNIKSLWTHLYGGYACDIIIKPGSYAEMPAEWQKLGIDSLYIQTEKPCLIILNYIQ